MISYKIKFVPKISYPSLIYTSTSSKQMQITISCAEKPHKSKSYIYIYIRSVIKHKTYIFILTWFLGADDLHLHVIGYYVNDAAALQIHGPASVKSIIHTTLNIRVNFMSQT